MMRDDLFYSMTTTVNMKSTLHIDGFKKNYVNVQEWPKSVHRPISNPEFVAGVESC